MNRAVQTIAKIVAPAVVAAACFSIYAEPAPATRPATPATQPVSDEVRQLIGQLGNDDFHVREEAENKLAKMGRSAAPGLKEALKSEDPEIKSKAEAVLARIDAQEQPVAGGDQVFIRRGRLGGIRPMPMPLVRNQISVTVGNGVKTVDSDENGRKVHITENADGIAMTVTEQKDGKEVVSSYKAKNADELKTNSPDVFPLYQRLAGGGGAQIQGQIQINVVGDGAVQIAPNPKLIRPLPEVQVDDGPVREQLQVQRQEIDAQLEKVNADVARINADNARHIAEIQAQQREMQDRLNRRQEELRQQAEQPKQNAPE